MTNNLKKNDWQEFSYYLDLEEELDDEEDEDDEDLLDLEEERCL